MWKLLLVMVIACYLTQPAEAVGLWRGCVMHLVVLPGPLVMEVFSLRVRVNI